MWHVAKNQRTLGVSIEKTANNFSAIISKNGDEIIVNAEGQKFEYIVEGLRIIDPSETWVINPPDITGRYISLMTCVPPGLYLKRLIVLGRLK